MLNGVGYYMLFDFENDLENDLENELILNF